MAHARLPLCLSNIMSISKLGGIVHLPFHPPIFLVPSAKMSFGVLILGLLLFLIMHQTASTHFKGPRRWFHKRLAHPGVKPVVPSFLHPTRLWRNRDY
jgi:hypothetical protein